MYIIFELTVFVTIESVYLIVRNFDNPVLLDVRPYGGPHKLITL